MSHIEEDEQLRARIAALYSQPDDVEAALGGDAQRRVIARVAAEAARIQRARRRWRTAATGTVLLAAAAAVVLGLRARSSAPETVACGLPLLDAERRIEGQFTLGRYGELVASEAAQVSVEHSEACELAVRLERGTLAGDLHSLRPAQLRIRTPQGEVVVTGTRFAVHADDELEVLLDTGVVDVVFSDRSSVRLTPGTRLRKPRAPERAPERLPLSAADSKRLTALLAGVVLEAKAERQQPAPRVAAAPLPEAPAADGGGVPNKAPPLRAAGHEEPRDLLAEAEAARRAGHIDEARSAYQAASRGRGDSAEVALLRWVRLELDAGAPQAAQRVLALHKKRFSRGHLGAEASWQEVQVWQALGRSDRAHQAARELLARYGETPQAEGARRVLDAP